MRHRANDVVLIYTQSHSSTLAFFARLLIDGAGETFTTYEQFNLFVHPAPFARVENTLKETGRPRHLIPRRVPVNRPVDHRVVLPEDLVLLSLHQYLLASHTLEGALQAV